MEERISQFKRDKDEEAFEEELYKYMAREIEDYWKESGLDNELYCRIAHRVLIDLSNAVSASYKLGRLSL